MSTSAFRDDPRLYVQIANALREQIRDGTYKPGDAMPPIGELVTSHRVCRRTAGHALQVLADDGLVQFFPGLGYFVCELP